MRIRSFSLLIVYIVSLFICSAALGQKSQLGDLLEAPIEFGENNVNLRFRYVAPRSLSVTEPWLGDTGASPYLSSGFYIMETELSIADAARILGPKIITESNKRLSELVNADGGNGSWDYFVDALNTQSEEVPFFGISIEELILLSDVLSKASTSQNIPGNTIEGRIIRPLTVSEWRLAAIGKLHSQASAEHILFPNYPTPEDLDKKVYKGIKQRLRTAYKSMNTGREFNGSIEDIFAIFSFSGEFPDDIQGQVDEALRMFYCQAILPQATQSELNGPNPNPTTGLKNKYSHPNSIGVYDLMNGLAEWVMASKDESDAMLSWESLVKTTMNNPVDAQITKPMMFNLAGGSWNKGVTDKNGGGFWRTSTLWGSPKMNGEGVLRQFDLTVFDEVSWDVFAGVRLGLFRSLRPNWFEVVRNGYTNKFNGVQEPRQLFDSFEKTLSELSTDEETTKLSESVISFYRGLAYYNLEESILVENSLSKLDFPEVAPPTEEVSDDTIARAKAAAAAAAAAGGGRPPVFKKKTATYTATTPAGENGLFGDILIELTRLDNELVKGKTVPIERALTKTE